LQLGIPGLQVDGRIRGCRSCASARSCVVALCDGHIFFRINHRIKPEEKNRGFGNKFDFRAV